MHLRVFSLHKVPVRKESATPCWLDHSNRFFVHDGNTRRGWLKKTETAALLSEARLGQEGDTTHEGGTLPINANSVTPREAIFLVSMGGDESKSGEVQ